MGEKGSHFVAVYFDTSSIKLFDSLGLPQQNKHIRRFLDFYSSAQYFNSINIQSLLSDFCGYYCALFVILAERNMSMRDIIGMFWLKPCLENDELLIQILEYIFKHI